MWCQEAACEALRAWHHWEHGQVASSPSLKSWCCCPHWDEERLSCVRPAAVLEKREGSSFLIQAVTDPMGQQHQGEMCAACTSSSFHLLQRCFVLLGLGIQLPRLELPVLSSTDKASSVSPKLLISPEES